jgi:hypothetical protein
VDVVLHSCAFRIRRVSQLLQQLSCVWPGQHPAWQLLQLQLQGPLLLLLLLLWPTARLGLEGRIELGLGPGVHLSP